MMTEQVKKYVNYTIATHAAEKLALSREAVQLCKQTAAGILSADAAVAEIKRIYGVENRQLNG